MFSIPTPVGKIDCTVEKKLCGEYNIKGYPTLKFSLDGDIMDYPASRKPEHILAFAKKMSSPTVIVVKSYNEALQVAAENEDGIGFVAYHPDMVGDDLREEFQKALLTQVFGQVARKNQHIAHFILLVGKASVVSDFGIEDVSNGFVAKIEATVAPKIWKPREVSSPGLLQFVKEQNVPLVSSLGPHNFNKIGHTGRPLVIAAVDIKVEGLVEKVSAELRDFVLTGPIDIVEKYYFGWIDGKLWKSFLEQFNVSSDSLPQVFVVDVPSKMYWQNTDYTTVKEFLTAINEGDIPVRYSSTNPNGFAGTVKKAEYIFFKYMPYSLIAVVAVCALLVIMIVPSAEELRPPYPSRVAEAPTMSLDEDEREGESGDKDEEPKKDK